MHVFCLTPPHPPLRSQKSNVTLQHYLWIVLSINDPSVKNSYLFDFINGCYGCRKWPPKYAKIEINVTVIGAKIWRFNRPVNKAQANTKKIFKWMMKDNKMHKILCGPGCTKLKLN